MSASAAKRIVSPFPPPAGRLRVILDTDAANEIDDQWAIALALGAPERIAIEGIVAAHFGDKGGEDGIDKSFAEIQDTLAAAGMAGRFPVKRGSHPLRYGQVSEPSEGVDFIIERAMAGTPDDPLWVVGLGPATDIAAAYLKEPRVKDRMIAFWHGRTQWPTKCWNFNAYNDVRAVRTLFHSDLPFVLFDTGTDLTMSMPESAARLRPHGPLGRYVHDIRLRSPEWQTPTKGVFDVGDIAALVDPSLARYEVIPVPGVNWDMLYDHKRSYGQMVRVHAIDREGSFDLLERSLRRVAGTG